MSVFSVALGSYRWTLGMDRAHVTFGLRLTGTNVTALHSKTVPAAYGLGTVITDHVIRFSLIQCFRVLDFGTKSKN